MKRWWLLILILTEIILLGEIPAGAVTYFPKKSGNWSDANIWSPRGIPSGAADIACTSGAWAVIVNGNHEIGTVQCGYFTGKSDSYGGMSVPYDNDSLKVINNLFVAYPKNCNGRFTQLKGTVTVGKYLMVKYEAGTNHYSEYPGGTSWGEYLLRDGTLTVEQRTYVGSRGKGSFVQSGGTHTTPWLFVGENNPASLGAASDIAYYTMTGGVLNVGTNLSLGVNGSARGVFNFGDARSTGTITGKGNLWCRHMNNAADGIGVFQGWGQVNLTGKLYNNGKVIADSRSNTEVQKDRDLNMSSFSSMTKDKTLVPVEGMGWYAINRGRLILPMLKIAPGSSKANWGEDVGETTPDLINSVAMTFNNVNGGSLGVSLLAPDRGDASLVDQKVISVWNFDGTSFDFGHGSVDLTFKYDTAMATRFGINESDLKFYRRVGNTWQKVGVSIDTSAKLIIARNIPAFSMFAIGVIDNATPAPGDANDDGRVDVEDLKILSDNYGLARGATWAKGDFNKDGVVDVGDLAILMGNYGWGTSSLVNVSDISPNLLSTGRPSPGR